MFFNLRSIYSQKHIRMKKFILHGNRCIVVTRFFNLDFARHIKGRYPWNEVAEQKIFLSQQASFLLQTGLEEISQLSKIVRKRGKTFI